MGEKVTGAAIFGFGIVIGYMFSEWFHIQVEEMKEEQKMVKKKSKEKS